MAIKTPAKHMLTRSWREIVFISLLWIKTDFALIWAVYLGVLGVCCGTPTYKRWLQHSYIQNRVYIFDYLFSLVLVVCLTFVVLVIVEDPVIWFICLSLYGIGQIESIGILIPLHKARYSK